MAAFLLVALLAALMPAPATAEPPAAATRVERRLALMGTVLEMSVEAESRATALAASEEAVRALEAAEARLSTWREDTELARLNRAPVGERVVLSLELASELAHARTWWQETGGAFDPGIGALIEAWGLRTGGRVPAEDERRAAVAAGGMASLGLADGAAVRLKPGLRIEEGGFGKGAALDQALGALRSRNVRRAVLDLGGQLLVLGGGEPVEVEVADPRERDRPVLVLRIDQGSVSTSGNSERGTMVGGVRVGHILDPKRGEPAPDFGSLTVWAPDAITADCLSTGLYVLGPDAALAWAAERPGIIAERPGIIAERPGITAERPGIIAERPGIIAERPGIEVLVIESLDEGLRARATDGLRERITVVAADVELRWNPERSTP